MIAGPDALLLRSDVKTRGEGLSTVAEFTIAEGERKFGSDNLDASLLMIPLVGFLPPGDERVSSTVERIQNELIADGFVLRYHRSKQ
jgi:GH15 family glucan-1,4-alpha-glucosidase